MKKKFKDYNIQNYYQKKAFLKNNKVYWYNSIILNSTYFYYKFCIKIKNYSKININKLHYKISLHYKCKLLSYHLSIFQKIWIWILYLSKLYKKKKKLNFKFNLLINHLNLKIYHRKKQKKNHISVIRAPFIFKKHFQQFTKNIFISYITLKNITNLKLLINYNLFLNFIIKQNFGGVYYICYKKKNYV